MKKIVHVSHKKSKEKNKAKDINDEHMVNRVGQTIVLMCQKFKSSYFKLKFPFLMKSYTTDSIFSPIG